MAVQAFTRNHTDHSNDTGYQFEFHCDKCGNGYRSTFQASALGVGSKIAKGLGSLFGGSRLWGAGVAADYMKDGLRGSGWDDAFKKAIEEIKPKFHQCTRCGNWVCPEVCWNEARGLCEACAPDLAEEAAHHQAQIASQQIAGKMHQVDLVEGVDVKQQMLAGCPHCKARLAPGAKFCASCGKPVGQTAAANKFCTGCGGQLQAGAKFCASCGTPAAT
ncbi:MAG TPA: zinc ribbon domain-containing protein [Kofleriaceae bacterium]|nr:zinc ribbon domain-containing protein [Kofleriaceae bacterium]